MATRKPGSKKKTIIIIIILLLILIAGGVVGFILATAAIGFGVWI